MTSSPERQRDATARAAGPAIEPLPPALSSMWRLCKLGYRHEPRLMLAAFVLSQLSALPDALLALWLMLLGKGVLEHRPGLVRAAAIGLGVSAAARPSMNSGRPEPVEGFGTGESDSGRITILVSHRFSTVRMADLIVVLDGELVEVGTHEELMARRGQYSELYGIQAAAYR